MAVDFPVWISLWQLTFYKVYISLTIHIIQIWFNSAEMVQYSINILYKVTLDTFKKELNSL